MRMRITNDRKRDANAYCSRALESSREFSCATAAQITLSRQGKGETPTGNQRAISKNSMTRASRQLYRALRSERYNLERRLTRGKRAFLWEVARGNGWLLTWVRFGIEA